MSNEITDENTNEMPVQELDPTEQISPGKYTAEIVEVTLTQHVTEQYDIVKVKFEISAGRYAKEICNKVYHLKSPKSKVYLQKEFAILGVKIDSRKELITRHQELVGKLPQIEVKNDSGNMSIYIQHDARKTVPKVDPESVWEKPAKTDGTELTA